MYNINRTYIHKYLYQIIYIASKTTPTLDGKGNELPTYEKPILYTNFNIQPVTSDSEIKEFGELAPRMKVAVLTARDKYNNVFKEYDKAYLDGASPSNEVIYGTNANYRIYSIRNQNTAIRIYFLSEIEAN